MSSLCRKLGVIAACGAIVLTAATRAHAGDVYPAFGAAQSQRGNQLFTARCASCHGADLAGVSGPPLIADATATGDTPKIGDVFATIVHRMPKSDPGSLTPAQAADVIAYLLTVNGYSSGTHDLKPDDAAAATMPYVHAAVIRTK